jgi:hypothetical protein
MSATKSLAIAAVLAVISQHAAAQSVNAEPGYCAQYNPNANCQDTGPGSPCAGPNPRNLTYAAAGQSVGVAGRRQRHHRAPTPIQ